jgi:hypothetical protein
MQPTGHRFDIPALNKQYLTQQQCSWKCRGQIIGIIIRILLKGEWENIRDMKKMNEVSAECNSQHYS